MAGCGSRQKDKIWVNRYPDFYNADLKRVAVLPFGNRTRFGGAGQRISDTVSAGLTNNGTYEVYTRRHLKDILAERDLAAAGIIDSDVAMEIGRLKSVQALICGVCNRYEATTHTETRYNNVAVWGYNNYGHYVITGWRQVPYVWTKHDAYVGCHVVVIDTATGRQIAAVNSPSNYWATGSPPQYGPDDALRFAEQAQVNFILQNVAITRAEIELEGDILRMATGLYDQEWDWQKRFTSGDECMHVVVTLPPEADRNTFRIAIVPKDRRDVAAEQPFVWTRQYGSFGYRFEIKPIVDKFGPGEYQAKLYSGPEPIAWYDFSIVARR